MEPVMHSLWAGLPVLVLHFAVTMAMLALALAVYVRLTPFDELALIRAGNVAAAISLSGATLGLALPLAFCLASSVGVLDIFLWGLATLLIQIVSFRVTDYLLKDLPARIQAGEIGAALYLVSVKLSIAAINAAAVTG